MKFRLAMAIAAMTAGTIFGEVVWTNDMAILTFDWAGGVKSLRERATGRELAKPGSFLFVNSKDKLLYSNGMKDAGGGHYRWSFPGGGHIMLKAHSFGMGWTYELVEIDVEQPGMLYFGWLKPCIKKWVGSPLNMISDDDSGVVLRSDRPGVGMHSRNGTDLFLDVDPKYGHVGAKGGIVAGPRVKLVEALRQMTLDFGVYHTSCSGAWALGSDRAKGSYLFTEMSPGSSDDWIDLAERGGFDTIHMHNAGSRGHYEPTSVLYPRGYDDFKLCADRIHEAGLRVGMHTLTAGINPRDPWITPVCRTDLIVRCTHTLAKPLGENDAVLYVNEKPENFHHTFHSYGSNGNTFRVGGELIQYTGIKPDEPYAFTGVTRGAWKTVKTGTLPAGTEIHYLHQRYDAFYPEPNTKLVNEMGDRIAKLFHCGKLDQIYFDGSEGLASRKPSSRYDIDRVRLDFAKKLGPDALIEGSCTQASDCWWYLSRYGAWDHSLWGAKLFQDQHSRDIDYIRKGNLLEPQMGWWKPRQADGRARGHFLDELEYFAKRNTADDAPMSLQGVDLRRQRITPYSVTCQVTALGWYERLRRAGAFTPEALALFGQEGVDVRLRQRADGRWTCQRSDAVYHRVTGVGDGSEKWTVKADKAGRAALRVEALYAADATAEGKTFVSPDDAFKVSGAEDPKVEAVLERVDSEHGKTLVLTAANKGDRLRGSWAGAVWHTESPYRNMGGLASYGFWVKGDGKGETLCLGFKNAPEYSHRMSVHFLKIDFTGWRHVEFLQRERDAARWEEFLWPFSNIHNMSYLASNVDLEHLNEIGFYLNEVPVGGVACVKISAVTAKPVTKNVTSSPVVTVNGEEHRLPFELASGDYAELEGGFWTHYSEQGVPLARRAADSAILASGENTVSYSGAASKGGARAEVTVFALGRPFAATKDLASLTGEAKRRVAYEAAMPVYFAPAKGFAGCVSVPVRPDEKAFLELRITGPVADPSLTIRDGTERVWTFPAKLMAKDRLFCRDGRCWYVLREKSLDTSDIVAKGVLDEPLSVLAKSAEFVFGSSDPASAAAEIDVIKRYGGDRHPGLDRKLTYGQGASGAGDTEGILNSNWKAK